MSSGSPTITIPLAGPTRPKSCKTCATAFTCTPRGSQTHCSLQLTHERTQDERICIRINSEYCLVEIAQTVRALLLQLHISGSNPVMLRFAVIVDMIRRLFHPARLDAYPTHSPFVPSFGGRNPSNKSDSLDSKSSSASSYTCHSSHQG